jgi:protocatechuate 3,4-dioxygenase, beta subunit
MHRRVFLALLSAPASASVLRPFAASAQDVEFERALQRAERERPAAIGPAARIAPPDEPGDPLVIHGRVLAADGRSPVADALVFAYHTDRTGVYAPEGSPAHTWRLRGWARTDSQGRFEFRTIRPGSYPSRRQAAHVHFNVFTAEGSFHGGALEFDDDPLIGPDDRRRANASGEFGTIREVRREGNTQHVDFAIRLNPARAVLKQP